MLYNSSNVILFMPSSFVISLFTENLVLIAINTSFCSGKFDMLDISVPDFFNLISSSMGNFYLFCKPKLPGNLISSIVVDINRFVV